VALSGTGRFCAQCGAPVTPSVAAPTGAPAADLAPLRAARAQSNWPAVGVGLLALALTTAGVTFLVLRDDSGTQPVTLPTSVIDATLAPTVPTTAEPMSAAEQLAATRVADRPAVEALVGRWVPQLSAKREGTEADGIVYTAADVLALHSRLHAQFGTALFWSGDYVFTQGDLWISIVPTGYATPQDALAWCASAALGRDDCLAKLISHDPTITDTAQLQP